MSLAKRPMRQPGLIALALLLTGFGCGARSETSRDGQNTNAAVVAKSAEGSQRVRAPAVAGLFYPGEAAALSKAVDGLLAERAGAPHPPAEGSGLSARGLRVFRADGRHRLQAAGRARRANRGGHGAEPLCAVSRARASPMRTLTRRRWGWCRSRRRPKALASVAPFVLEPQCLVQRPGLVAAGAEARAGGRPGHARDVGAFGRGAGAFPAEGAEELQTPAGGDWRGGPGAGGQGAGRAAWMTKRLLSPVPT